MFVQQGTLFVAPFDVSRLEVTGPPVPAIEALSSANNNGSGQFAVSETGTAVYVSGKAASNAAPIAWLDQSGKTTTLRATPSDWSSPSFSPDGSRLACASDDYTVKVWDTQKDQECLALKMGGRGRRLRHGAA